MDRFEHGARARRALTSGALALPGLAALSAFSSLVPEEAAADAPVQETTARYAFSFYKEDNLSPGKFVNATGTGSRERYEIQAHQFSLLTPLTSRIDASADLVFESMAGASPWWVEENPNFASTGQAFLQVMSGATIFEERFDGQLTVNHYFERGKATLSGGVSSEKDYLSGNVSFGAERSYNDKNTVHSFGIGYSWDTITPTDGAVLHDRTLAAYLKNSLVLDTALSQVLTRRSLVQLAFAYKRSTGFLSDPYKRFRVVLTNETLPDSRPTERNQITMSARYRHHVERLAGSVHADVAFHWDDWDVIGMSSELAWFQTLGPRFSIVPNLRYYSQSQASFYGPVFQSRTALGTSDYRLSPYGALSYGLRGEADLSDWPSRGWKWLLTLGADRYTSRGELALQTVRNESPGLVDYWLFSAQLGGRF